MKLKTFARRAAAAGAVLAALMLAALPALAAPKVQVSTTNAVADHADILSDETEQYVNDVSIKLSDACGAQIGVYTLDELLGSTTMEGFAYDVFNAWGLGSDDLDNGVLLLLAPNEADGGDYSKISLVPYNVDDEVSGLKANMFDTVWVYEGWAVQNAKVQNYDVNYFSFISIDDVFDYYTPVIAANDDFAKENPDQVKAFLRAVKKGYEFCVENPSDAADILCDAVPELDPDLVHASQDYLAGQYIADASSWGVIDADRWSKFYQWLNDQNLVENELDVTKGYDLSYLEA